MKRTGYFEDVKLEQKRISKDKVDIIVNVVETSTGAITLGGGYGSADKLMVSASLSDKNVFGSGIGVGVNVDLSARENKFSISATNPAINDSEYTGRFEIHNTETEINRSDYELDKTAKGFSVSVGKNFLRDLNAGLRYRFDKMDENYTYKDSSKEGNPAYFQDTEYYTSSITPYLTVNTTDDFYFPREGYITKTSIEYAGVGGDSKYIKTSSSFKYFYSFEDLTELDWIFRFKTQVKVLGDMGQTNPGDSLYLGGVRSLRGFKSYAFGPNNDEGLKEDPYKRMWANSIEMNFPLIPTSKMRWGVFYDYGMIGKDDFDDIQRSSTGALFQWLSPVGPLQFIFAQPIDDKPGDDTASFEFSLGASF